MFYYYKQYIWENITLRALKYINFIRCFNLPIITCLHDNTKSLWACKLCSIIFSFIVCLSSLHVTKYSKTYNIMKLRINSELNLPTEREPGGSISVDLTRAAGCIEESSWLDPG